MTDQFEKHHIPAVVFDKIYSTLALCNKTLSELNFIENIVHTDDESEVLNNFSFDFYKRTLRYCFINEYGKLFENGPADDPSNISSINNINKYLFKTLGSKFEAVFLKNKNLLSSVSLSPFYHQQLELKNNCSDAILSFNYMQVQQAFQHLVIAHQALSNCLQIFDIHYELMIPNPDTRTVDFVMDHSVFRKFYYDNYLKSLD